MLERIRRRGDRGDKDRVERLVEPTVGKRFAIASHHASLPSELKHSKPQKLP